jgi:peptide/nickel transport system substrate-binding protein
MPHLGRRDMLALGGAALAAWGGAASSAARAQGAKPAKPIGQVVIGLSQEPTVFNPLMPSIEVDQGIALNVFNPLWLADPEANLMPQLAVEVPSVENGGISEGGLLWKVKLREGVVWHDGAPFTAEDVKFTLELINTSGFRARTRQGHSLVRDIQVLGPHEISWRMEKAFSPYLSLLAETFIVPKHILSKAEDPNTAPFNNAPVGTGPFRWGERRPGEHLTLVANERYFGEGPYLERAVFKYIPDLTALYTQLRTGQIDATVGVGILANFYEEARKNPTLHVVTVPSNSLEVIMPNLGMPALADKAVRQALYTSINKQAILDTIYYGLPKPTESITPQQYWAYNPDLPKQEYDLAKANKLLDDAGWRRAGRGVRQKDGVRLEFTVSTTSGNALREQVQQLMQQDWLQIGASMKINNMPAAVIWGDFYTRSKFETLLVGTNFVTGNDPDMSTRFNSGAIPVKGGAGGNYMQYQNAKVDELMLAAQTSFDRAERKRLYSEVQVILRDELPVLPIFQYAPVEGIKKGINGFRPNINYKSNTWNMHTWSWAA